MGSRTAAEGKADKLMRWAGQIGEILSKKAFGEHGPDLQTSLADMEALLGPVLKQLAAGFLEKAVSDQAERLPGEAACPTCGMVCVLVAQEKQRHMTTEHGDFDFGERVGHCDRCGRSFFPSAEDSQD
jgi:hypothetical protein